jgi:hypothetical protein
VCVCVCACVCAGVRECVRVCACVCACVCSEPNSIERHSQMLIYYTSGLSIGAFNVETEPNLLYYGSIILRFDILKVRRFLHAF